MLAIAEPGAKPKAERFDRPLWRDGRIFLLHFPVRQLPDTVLLSLSPSGDKSSPYNPAMVLAPLNRSWTQMDTNDGQVIRGYSRAVAVKQFASLATELVRSARRADG
jgi:hypothetical protein